MKVLDLALDGNIEDMADGVGTLGSELISNGDFASWSGDDPVNWAVFNEDGNNYVTESSGTARFVSDDSAVLSMGQSLSTLVPGQLYILSFDIVINTQGWRFKLTDGVGDLVALDNYTTAGHHVFRFVPRTNNITVMFYRYSGASSDYTLDNVSVKLLSPLGTYNKPSAGTYIDPTGVLRTGWGNRTQLIDVSAQNDITTWWTLTRAANSTPNAIIADTSTDSHLIRRNSIITGGKSYVFSVELKAGAVGWAVLSHQDSGGLYYDTYFDLINGAVGQSPATNITNIENRGYGWFRCSIMFTSAVAGHIFIWSAEGNQDVVFTGDDTSVSTHIRNIMLEELPSGNVLGDDLFDQETLGSELVTNGNFETGDPPSSWTAQGTNTIEASADVPTGGGSQSIKITRVDSNWAVAQALSLTAGKTYKITFWAKLGTADSLGYVLDGISQASILKPATWTQYTFYYNYTGKSSTFYLALVNAGTAWFDNVSVKEVTGAARGMPAAEVLGPELCPSPDCSTDFWDSKDANWTHDAVNDEFDSDGSQGTNADMREDGVVVVGEVYKVVWTIANRSAGSAWVSCGNTGVGATRDANGTYTEYIKAAGNTNFYVWGDSSFVGSVSAISIKMVSKGGLWPALAGVEAITAQNDRDFSSGTIGNWTASADGSGTCAYDNTDVGGYDDKQALLTSSGDTYLYGTIDQTDLETITANKLYRISANVQVPAANSLKTARIRTSGVWGTANWKDLALSDDTYTEIVAYAFLTSTSGAIHVGFAGNPADGDKLYFDDISIRPVQFSWRPYGSSNNLIEIDEVEDAFKVTYVDNAAGSWIYLSNAWDLSTDLTVGETYLMQFDAKVGAGDTVKALINVVTGDDVYTGNIAESWTTYKLVFTASSTGSDMIVFSDMGAGDVVYIRNMSLKVVPNLAMLSPSPFVNSTTIPAHPRYEINGLLLEGEATNLLLYSEDLTTPGSGGVWASGAGGETCAANEVGPDGVANSAFTITDAGGGLAASWRQIVGHPLITNAQYALSVLVKEGTAPAFSLAIYDGTAVAHRARVDYQWISGVLSVKAEDLGTGYVEQISSSWWRAVVVAPINVIVGGNQNRVYLYPTEHYVDPGTSQYTIFFGPQLEQSTYATSYIPTTTCPVTRLSDSADAANNGVYWDMTQQLTNVLQEALGSEKLTNGGFDTDTDWTKGSGCTITGGELVATAATSTTYQTGVGITDGKLYKVVFTISDYTSGSVKPVLLGSPNTDGTTRSSAGTFVDYITPSGANGNFGFSFASATMDIDIVSVKEVTRQSKGTLLLDWTPRYSEAEGGTETPGFVVLANTMTSIVYTQHNDSLVSYDATTAVNVALTWVRNAKYQVAVRWGFLDQALQKFEAGVKKYERLGLEEITDPEFDSPGAWVVGTNWSVSGGFAVGDAATGMVYEAVDLVDGATYKCEVYITSVTAGGVTIYCNGNQSSTISSIGKSTVYVVAGTANTNLGVNGIVFTGTVEYVSIKRVTIAEAWTWGTAGLYDGAFNVGTRLRLSFGSILPVNYKNLKIYDVVYSQAQIEAGLYQERKRKWLGWFN